MENENLLFIIIVGFLVFSFILMIGLIIFIIMASKKFVQNREKIKNTKPKQKFEYVDFFFYNVRSFNETNGAYYGYFVIRDVETSTIYAIHNRNANASFEIISTFNTKKMTLFLNTSPRKDIKIGDKGSFWISKIQNNEFYFRKNNDVKIGIDMFNYKGTIDSVKGINSYNGLYNLNSTYDISLLDNAKFIEGIVDFNIND